MSKQIQDLTEIIQNQHFNQFASILSVAMSPEWRTCHPKVPSVRATLEQMAKLIKSSSIDTLAFVRMWSGLFVELTIADPHLTYSTDDMDWFASVMDNTQASVTFSMLFAVASTPRDFLDATQLATLTREAESTWRNRAAAGEIIGAFKAGGKAWMFPVLSLRAYGVSVKNVFDERKAIEDEEDTQ